MAGNIPGGNFLGGNFPGSNFPGGSWWGGIFRVGIFPGGNFPRTVFKLLCECKHFLVIVLTNVSIRSIIHFRSKINKCICSGSIKNVLLSSSKYTNGSWGMFFSDLESFYINKIILILI